MTNLIIHLGKTGDLLNLLPLLRKMAESGTKPKLMVAEEFASVLEGVSYVEPVIFKGAHHDIAGAVALAEEMKEEWICTQVNGPKDQVAEFVYKPAKLASAVTTSFQKETWRILGRLAEWDANYPLVFDQRDKEREAKLLAEVLPKPPKKGMRKLILMACEGKSSPFPYVPLLKELVQHRFYRPDKYDILEVPTTAHRIYDLLALYERAWCLIAMDSAPLHLARAVPQLPTVALVNDKPMLWHGSPWRPNHIFYCRYLDFPHRAVDMLDRIERLGFFGYTPRTWQESTIFHIWNAYGGETPPAWKYEDGQWIALPIEPGACGRDAAMMLNDPQRVPYLRDCIRMGLQAARPGDFICLTRPDVGPRESDIGAILKTHSACYAYRIQGGDWAPIVDLFCATKEWWEPRIKGIPDFVFGKDYHWSHALWAMFKQGGAVDVTGAVGRHVQPKKEPAKETPPRVQHNLKLAGAYVKEHGVTCRFPKVSEQVESERLDLSGLKPFSYNPSIVDTDEGFMVLAARFHPEATTATLITLSQIDPDGVVSNNKVLDLETTAEDPKLFPGLNRWPWLSYVASSLPRAFRSVVRYTEVVNGKHMSMITPKIGKNDFSRMEKNWVFWWRDGALLCLYQCQPTQIVYRVDGEVASDPVETPGPTWVYGPIRGGTAPVEYDGGLLRFFHSGLDNEPGMYRRRYFMGAYLMEKEPPFKVLRVSKKPILYGSEIDDMKVKDRPHHWKANVVFPGGAVVRPHGWTVAVGVNDSACLLAKIKPENLNL